MGFTMEDYAEYEKLGPDDRKGYATKTSLVENLDYPMTPEGQAEFMNDIMKLIDDVPGGDGFYYWEAGWIPVPGSGWATEGALSYIEESGPCGNEWANQALLTMMDMLCRHLKPYAITSLHMTTIRSNKECWSNIWDGGWHLSPVVSDSKVHVFDTFGYVLAGRVCV